LTYVYDHNPFAGIVFNVHGVDNPSVGD
jgi:hypothetical protein